MNRKLILFFIIILLGAYNPSKAQVVCPPNIDFELGNLSYWKFWNGTVASGPTYTFATTTPWFRREELMTGTGVDAYGGFPVVPPGGGAFALRLGHDTPNYCAEKAAYYIHVPKGSSSYALIYQYAVVLNDGGHGSADQPRFVVTAKDSATGVNIPCALYNYVSGSLPGFIRSTVGFNNDYKPWATGSINLSGMGGKVVAIEVIAAGCSASGHWGYGYFDASCGLFAIDSKICDDTLATLTGPSGFSSYQWFDSSTFTLVGSSQIVSIPIPDTPTTFALVIQPFVGFGCPDTLYTRIMPSYLQLHPSNDTLVCEKAAINLRAGATDSALAMPLTYSWAPAVGLSCTNCDNPVATPISTTAYTVTVTNKAGCVKKDVITVTTDGVTSTMSKVNDSCFGFNNGSATVTPVTGIPPFSYVWSTVPLQTGIKATGLVAGTYSVTITDNLGCKGTATANITQPPPNNLTISAFAGPTTCFGNDGYIALIGLTAGKTYTITYEYNGVPASHTGIAGPVGNDTIKSLQSGIYDKITVNISLLPRPRCPFNTVGPLTLNDPPTPPVPAVGNNGPLCKGDTLRLSAKDGMPGVSFDWTGPGGFTWNLPDTAVENIDFPQAGSYTVTVTKNGCKSWASTPVIIKPNPVPSAVGDTACAGSDLQLSASSSNGADAYRWEGPGAYFSFEQNPVVKSGKFSAGGVYTVVATLAGCKASTTAELIVVAAPAKPVVTDTTYCQYDRPVPALSATGTTLTWYAASGNIYPGTPTPNTDVAGVTKWYVDDRITGPGTTNPVVCVSERASATVTVYPKYNPSLAATDTVICTGNEITFTVNNLGDDKDGIRWSLAEGDSIKDVNPLRHSFDAIGTYTLSVTPMHKVCPNPTLTRVIHVFPYPVINLGPDTAICIGSKSITLVDEVNANNPRARWLWNTNETGPSITVTKPGVYYTRLIINGCPVADTVTVLNDCYIDVPNAFTPNGDGKNDYFFPRQYMTKGLTGFSIEIYNRWGQMVFSSKSLDGMGWDGRFNDIPQPQGVYIFNIDATFKDGQMEHHTGNVTLLR